MIRPQQRWTLAGGIAPLAEWLLPYVCGMLSYDSYGLHGPIGGPIDADHQALQLAHELREQLACGMYDALLVECLNARYPSTGAAYILDAGVIRPIKATSVERTAYATAAEFLQAVHLSGSM